MVGTGWQCWGSRCLQHCTMLPVITQPRQTMRAHASLSYTLVLKRMFVQANARASKVVAALKSLRPQHTNISIAGSGGLGLEVHPITCTALILVTCIPAPVTAHKCIPQHA